MAATSFTRSLFTTPSPKYDDFLVGNAAYIPPSFESIATATGTGSSATITFSSIPSTYKHLQLRIFARQTAGSDSTLLFTYNNDTGTNYVYHILDYFGSGPTSSGSTGSNVGLAGWTYSGANIGATTIVDIIDYASTTKNKVARSISGFDFNSVGNGRIALLSNLWLSTSAITSIQISTNGAQNWATNATFALYGVKG